MSTPGRHRITLVEVVAVILVIAVVGWLMFGQAAESRNLLSHPASSLSSFAPGDRQRAVLNNLRKIATASMQYMLDKGVTRASYRDVVGTTTDGYIRAITPIAGEDYTRLTVAQTQTQVSISAASFGLVTYNL